MKTMGCRFFVGFTQFVSTSSTAASSRPRTFSSPVPCASWKVFSRLPDGDWTVMLVSTYSTTVMQAAPISPVEAGRRP